MARIKKMISITVRPDLIVRLDKWRDAQEFPPQKNTVFEVALEEFLDRREAKEKGRK